MLLRDRVIYLILLISLLPGFSAAGHAEPGGGPDLQVPERVISLSPSSTEILFALGLDESIVGVTRFCEYPQAASGKAKVGGYLDPNYEIIALLEPDLVITLPEQESARRYLDQLGIRHMTVDNKKIEDILSAITAIGKACDAGREADSLVSSLRSRIDKVRTRTENMARPKTLVTIGRDFEERMLGKIYVAGRETYFNEIIEIAGGVNACGAELVRYPVLSAEGVLAIDPEVIVELVPGADLEGYSREKLILPWKRLGSVAAVKGRRIHIMTENYTQIPGPRFILLLEEMAEILHPE